jgi:hypothetical protein
LGDVHSTPRKEPARESVAQRPALASRKIHEAFIPRQATRFGGFNALSDSVRALGVEWGVVAAFGQGKAPWATYSLPDLRHVLVGLQQSSNGAQLRRGASPFSCC